MTVRTVAYRGIGLIAAVCACAIVAGCSSSDGPTNNDPITAIFQCGQAEVEARFMSRRMALFIDGRAYSLHQAESASGARYVGSDGPRKIEFWNKGEEATLTFGENSHPTCRQTEAAAKP
jgi:membrane-bound inhibitor of C-type lysozyme